MKKAHVATPISPERYRTFGSTGIKISPLTFGAWSIGGAANIGGVEVGWSGVEDATSLRAIEEAVELGINCFDTADAYGRGHSETLLGQALSGKRDQVVISSKCGITEKDGALTLDFSKDHILACCESSLKRLRTDYLDIYFLHLVRDGYPLGNEAKEALELLKSQGKIRAYGVSVEFPHQGMEQLSKNFGKSMMIEYNPLTEKAVEEVIHEAHRHGVGVMTRGAYGKGLLTGKYQAGHRFDATDVRSRLKGDFIDATLEKVEKIKALGEEKGFSLLSMCLAFPLRLPGTRSITLGLKTPEQVRKSVDAFQYAGAFPWEEIIRHLKRA